MKSLDLNKKWFKVFQRNDDCLNSKSLDLIHIRSEMLGVYSNFLTEEEIEKEDLRGYTITTDIFHYEDFQYYNRPFPFKKC